MKRNISFKTLFVFLALSMLLTITPGAMAGTITLNYGEHHSGNGGEFKISGLDVLDYYSSYAKDSTGFYTFCLESNEYFNPGGHYYYAISDGAINGGASGGNPDYISKGTAYLYSQFAAGNIKLITDTAAGNFQNAIWMLEGELTFNSGNFYIQQAQTYFNSLGQNMLDNANGLFGVHVLNIWSNEDLTGPCQDQLVITPEPGSLLLLGFGLLGLGALRKRGVI